MEIKTKATTKLIEFVAQQMTKGKIDRSIVDRLVRLISEAENEQFNNGLEMGGKNLNP